MDDEAMRWGDAMGLCYHRPIASPHRPSHRLIVHRIASSSIASPHRPLHRPIASPHRPSHRLIVHRIASSSIALDIIRNASVSLLGHHTQARTHIFASSCKIHPPVERGSSVVECRTRNRVSTGSNPPLLPFRRLGIFVLSIVVPVDSAV